MNTVQSNKSNMKDLVPQTISQFPNTTRASFRLQENDVAGLI